MCKATEPIESQFPHKSTTYVHILSDDSPEIVFGKRNLKKTDANAGPKHLQRNPHSYVRHEGQIYHISEFLAWQQGRLYNLFLQPDAKIIFFIAHDKRYKVFPSSGKNTDSANLRHKEIVCLWNKHDFFVGKIKRMTTIPTRGKKCPSIIWLENIKNGPY